MELNAYLAIAMGLELVPRRRFLTMAARAAAVQNARVAFASTGFVAIQLVQERAKHVPQPKKAVGRMEFAAISRMTRTPTANASRASATVWASANTTMASRARRERSVCRGIARMESVAGLRVADCAKRARPRKKAAAPMGNAGSSPPIPTPTMNAPGLLRAADPMRACTCRLEVHARCRGNV